MLLQPKPYDFLAIGDITIDVFIKIKDAHVNCAINDTSCEICLKFADKVPFESATEVIGVGNSANAAVSAARLGLRSALVTNVGYDERGEQCIEALESNEVSTKYVKKNKEGRTNYHYVLWYGAERTILVRQESFKYSLPNIQPPKWIYLSSVGSDSLDFHFEIARYLKAHPETRLAFQPGTFQMKLGHEKLADLYKVTEAFICNVEESQRILGLPEQGLPENESEKYATIKDLLTKIADFGPKLVLITDGPKGAYMFVPEGRGYNEVGYYYMPIYPDPQDPIERTGCGDSFASTFVSALILGKNPVEALEWAPVNPMSVVQHVGAQEGLLTRDALEELLSKRPGHYKPIKF